ncbi:MAG: segregation and condensation protein A [Terriglobia bacterium]
MVDEPQLQQTSIPDASIAGSPREKVVMPADPSAPQLKLQIYEGPLDLLLDLIRKQKINIYDIPIAQITRQYLDYIHLLEELNIDVAGEFIFMAATLIHIKSRMFITPHPKAVQDEQEDPRQDLVHRLLEHEQFKNAAEMLQSKRMVEDASWSQPGIGEFIEAEDEPGLAVSVFDLIASFREVIERARKRPPLQVEREEVTVGQMIEHVKQVLLSRSHAVELEDLMEGYVAQQALIAMILALLEMVRIHAVILRQKELFGTVTIHRNKRFEEIMAGIDPAALDASLDGSVKPAGDEEENR